MSKIKTTALAAGIATLLGAGAAQGQSVPTMGQQLVDSVRAEVANEMSDGFKWGYSIDLFEKCCGTFEVLLDNEEWAASPDPKNRSAKRLVTDLRINKEGTTYEGVWNRVSAPDQCFWEVQQKPDLEYMRLFLRDPRNNTQINPGVDNADIGGLTQQLVGDLYNETRLALPYEQCRQVGFPGREDQAKLRTAFNASSDPHSIAQTYVADMLADGNLVLEKRVYRIQPDGEGFNGKSEYMMTARLTFGRKIVDGQRVADANSAILEVTDINAQTAPHWYAEAFVWLPGQDNLKDKRWKTDNKGWAPSIQNVDLVAVRNAHDQACGYRGVMNESWEFPDCVQTNQNLCFQRGRVGVSGSYDATPPEFNAGAGPASVVRRSQESGSMSFFSPTNEECLAKVLDGEGVNGHLWGFFTCGTNVGTEIRAKDYATGAEKVFTTQKGEPHQPIQDIQLFRKNY